MPNGNQLARFTYNQRLELVKSVRDRGGCGPDEVHTYAYDLTHNWTKKDGVSYTNNIADQLLAVAGGGSLSYNDSGQATDVQWHWYLCDIQGSTLMLTDASGHSAATYDYSDYGETRQTSGSTALYNPFLYTGQEYDFETSLYHLRARHYSPAKGRFFSRDPIGYAGGGNMYAYCAGDPIDFSDPAGLYQQGGLHGDLHLNVPHFPQSFALALQKLQKLIQSTSVPEGDKCVLSDVLKTLSDESLIFGYASGGIETKADFDQRAAMGIPTDNWAETTPYSVRNSMNVSVTFFGFVKFATNSDLANLIVHEGGHLLQGDALGHPPKIFDVLDRWLPPPSI